MKMLWPFRMGIERLGGPFTRSLVLAASRISSRSFVGRLLVREINFFFVTAVILIEVCL